MVEKIKKFLIDNDYFARHSGIELLEMKKGYAKAKMPIADYHLNGVRVVHGGAIFTLADFAFAAASNSHGKIAVGINVSVSYMKAATEGVLYAEAREVSLNSKIGNYIVEVTDAEEDLVAVFQGTTYRKRDDCPA